MANELIFKKMNNLSIYDLEEEQVFKLQKQIVENVSLKQMREAVTQACLQLSQVGDPSFGADVRYIALDNQQRLNIIFKLMHDYDLFEKGVTNLKKNKYGCAEDYEKVTGFLETTKSMIESIIKFGEFKQQEQEEALRLVEENRRLLLGGNE